MRLFLIQCCKSKGGDRELFPQPRSILQELPERAALLLQTARGRVLSRLPHRFKARQLSALSMYDGTLYSPVVKQRIAAGLGHAFILLIMSGGYGLLRPDEVIREYDVNIRETQDIWRPVIPAVLQEHAGFNNINEVDGIFSASGAYLDIARLCQRTCRPTFRIHHLDYHGSGAQQKVPLLQRELFLRLSLGELPTSVGGVSVKTES